MSYYNSRGNINVVTSDTTGKGLFSADGEVRVTVVSGSAWTGLYAADGSVNVVVVTSSATPLGLYHPCGAWRVVEASSEIGQFAPNGAYYVSGTFVLSDTEAKDLMGSELNGLTFSANDQSMAILDTTTPANNYDGELSVKLGSIRTSAGMTYLSSGLLGWGPENLLQQSQTFENVYWTAQGLTVTADAVTAPDGTLTAETITEDTSTGLHRVYKTAITTTDGNITFSVYAKQGTATWFQLYFTDVATTVYANFNLATGVVGNKHASATSAITSVGNGWYRCSLTFAGVASALSNVQFYTLNTDVASAGESYTGTSRTHYVWGAQLERAASASTYKPTTSAAYYGLRLDYDTRLTGGPGYLVEEARTNICLQSQDFTTTWTNASTTETANTTVAPDGTTTADRITCAAASAAHYMQQAITWTAAVYTVSVFVKYTNYQYLQITTWDGTTSKYCNFDIQSGATTGTQSGGTGSVQNVGNGWLRLVFVHTAAQAAAGGTITIAFINSGAAGSNPSWVAAGTETVDLWGGQVEVGAFATSYIPTTTATVTRAADTGNILATQFPIGATGNTLYVRHVVSQLTGKNNYIFNLCKDDGSSYMVLRTDTASSDIQAFAVTAGVLVTSIAPTPDIVPFTAQRVAFGAATSSFQAVAAGTLGSEDTSGTHPTSFDGLRFGTFAGQAAGLCWLKEGGVFPRRFTNAQMQAIAA